MKIRSIYMALALLLASCAGDGQKPLEAVVDEALARAEQQTLLMAEKYAGREGRLPRTSLRQVLPFGID